MRNLVVLLIHGPVRGSDGKAVSTAVTPLDITDVARSCASVGAGGYGIVQPDFNQQALVGRLVDHWQSGDAAQRNPTRIAAVRLISTVANLAEALAKWGPGKLIATSADAGAGTIDWQRAKKWVQSERCYLLIGTGYGLITQMIEEADGVLPALDYGSGYNHLSLRAATAIILSKIAD